MPSSTDGPIPILYYNTENHYLYFSSSFFLAVGFYRIFASVMKLALFASKNGLIALNSTKGHVVLISTLCASVLLFAATGHFIGVGTYRFAAIVLFPIGYSLAVLFMGQVAIALVEIIKMDPKIGLGMRLYQVFVVSVLIGLGIVHQYWQIYDFILLAISVMFLISNALILVVLRQLKITLQASPAGIENKKLKSLGLKLKWTIFLMVVCGLNGIAIVAQHSYILHTPTYNISNSVAALVRVNLMFLTQLGAGTIACVNAAVETLARNATKPIVNIKPSPKITRNQSTLLSEENQLNKKSLDPIVLRTEPTERKPNDYDNIHPANRSNTFKPRRIELAEQTVNWFQYPLNVHIFRYPNPYSHIDHRLYQMSISILLLAGLFELYISSTLYLLVYVTLSKLLVLTFGPRLDISQQIITRMRPYLVSIGMFKNTYLDSRPIRLNNLMALLIATVAWIAYFLNLDLAFRIILWAWYVQLTLSGFDDVSLGIIFHYYLNKYSLLPRVLSIREEVEYEVLN